MPQAAEDVMVMLRGSCTYNLQSLLLSAQVGLHVQMCFHTRACTTRTLPQYGKHEMKHMFCIIFVDSVPRLACTGTGTCRVPCVLTHKTRYGTCLNLVHTGSGWGCSVCVACRVDTPVCNTSSPHLQASFWDVHQPQPQQTPLKLLNLCRMTMQLS